MAYDKKGGSGKNGRGPFTKREGTGQGAARPFHGKGPGGPGGDRPGGDRPGGGYGAPRREGPKPRINRNDEVFDGSSSRPNKGQGRADTFFGKGTPAPHGHSAPRREGPKPRYHQGGEAPSFGATRPKGGPGRPGAYSDRPAPTEYGKRPMSPGPRRAAPTRSPVPPSVRDEGPREKMQPHYPFRSQPRVEDAPVRAPFAPERDRPEEAENILAGRNPIREAIRAGRSIEKLLVSEGELSGSARQIVSWAREAHIVVQYVDRTRLDQIYPNHQGMIAYVSMAAYHTVDDILAHAKERGEAPFIIALDSITDPHNLGAIIRSAECAGAHGVIIPERRSAGLNPAAVKAAAGACEYQRIAKVTNLARTLTDLKAQGLWVIGADMGGEPIDKVDITGPVALVIGSEGEGIGELISRQCDHLVALPVRGKIDSLNASVAAGILMYRVLQARGGFQA